VTKVAEIFKYCTFGNFKNDFYYCIVQ